MLAFSIPAPGRYYTACFAGEGVGAQRTATSLEPGELLSAQRHLQTFDSFHSPAHPVSTPFSGKLLMYSIHRTPRKISLHMYSIGQCG